MKAFFAFALVNLIAFVQCKGVEKTTEFGEKGDNDSHLYSEFFSVYRSSLDRYQYVSFPPPGLVKYYNITYVRINDYNPYLADVKKVDGEIGSSEITIRIKAPILRRIEATVDIFGTFIGPCFNKDNNNNASNNNNNNEANNEANNKDTDNKDADNKDADNNDDVNKDADNKDADNKDADKEANNNNNKPEFDIDIRAGGIGEENNAGA